MNDPLKTYLHDHQAGSRVAIDLLVNMRDDHAKEPLGEFAAQLLSEIEKDRDLLRELTERVGAPRSNPLKQALAWVGEKLTRLKLDRQVGRGLGTLQALETLALGIQGKLALWQVLEQLAENDPRFSGVDFEQLSERARDQHSRVEQERLDVARRVLRSSTAQNRAEHSQTVLGG